MVKGEKLYLMKYLKHLEGKKIVQTGITDDEFPFFKLDDGLIVEVSRDQEGNGPGFLFGLPRPK